MNANNKNANAKLLPFVFQLASAAAGMLLLSPRSTGASNPPAYATDFADRSAVLAAWTPQEGCAHCTKGSVPEAGGGKDECTNMTIAATSFSAEGMTHTTLVPGSPRGEETGGGVDLPGDTVSAERKQSTAQTA